VTFRIDHRERRRQRAIRFVVIGDDQVHAELACAQSRFGASNAAVNRDNEGHALGVEPIDGRTLQAVAVAQALGDEMHHVPAEQLERAAQDHGRSDPVDVVVTVNRDPLVLRQRLLDTQDRALHVGQLERIVQMFQRRVEEPRGAIHVGKPAQAQQPRDDRLHAECSSQRRGLVIVARQVVPQQARHFSCSLARMRSGAYALAPVALTRSGLSHIRVDEGGALFTHLAELVVARVEPRLDRQRRHVGERDR
jgi:hypothetical protein